MLYIHVYTYAFEGGLLYHIQCTCTTLVNMEIHMYIHVHVQCTCTGMLKIVVYTVYMYL